MSKFKYAIPGDTAHISDNFADHLKRGSAGGTDYTDRRLTVMRAMAAGTVVMVDSNPDGSGGRMIRIKHDDGDSTEELHAQSFIVSRGQRVAMRQAIGYSGGSGFGSDYYYGAHIHAHGVHSNGVRFDVEPYVDPRNPTNPFASTAGGDPKPIPVPEEDIVASIAELEAVLDKRVGVLKDIILREGRARLIFDSGMSGHTPFSQSVRAAIARQGRVWPLSAVPARRDYEIAQLKAENGLFLPAAENAQGIRTMQFYKLIDLFNDPAPAFGTFVGNFFELEGGGTMHHRTTGNIEYPTRQDVWADGRPVTLTKGGKIITQFARIGSLSYARYADKTQSPLLPNEVDRANAQTVNGQVWVTS